MLLPPTKPFQSEAKWRRRPTSYPRSRLHLSANNLVVRRTLITWEARQLCGSPLCNCCR